MDRSELLPCPFCGAPAERIDFGPGDAENEGGSCIACTRCQSSGPVEFGRKENFVSNWNRRAAPPPPAEQASGGCRWITQTSFYDPANPDVCTGNCTEAAIASILGIRLDEVPSWAGMKSPEFWFAVEGFFASRGFAMLRKPGNYVPECLYLASGRSPRGCSHMVVMRDGKLVHDPHPSRAGIDPVEHVWLIVPLDPAAHPVEVRDA